MLVFSFMLPFYKFNDGAFFLEEKTNKKSDRKKNVLCYIIESDDRKWCA